MDTNTNPMRPSIDLTIEEVTSTEAFHALNGEWNSLLQRTGTPQIYLTHEWLTAWWECHGGRTRSLWILLARRDGVLAGIAPFMVVRGNWWGIPHRRLEFISTMQHAYSPVNCSASLNLIIPVDEPDAASAILTYLSTRHDVWNVARLSPVPEDSDLGTILRSGAGAFRLRSCEQVVFANAVVDTSHGWDNYRGSRSKQFRKRLRSYERLVGERGDIALLEFNGVDEFPGGLEGLLRIERSSWKEGSGFPLDAPVYRSFYERLLRSMSAARRLRLFALRIGDHLAAYDICLELDGRVESLKSSYDPLFKDLSPGAVMTMLELRKLSEERKGILNLLWGDFWYKGRWCTAVEPQLEILVFHESPTSRLLNLLVFRSSLYKLGRRMWMLRTASPLLRRLFPIS